jgi:hypothetical protein
MWFFIIWLIGWFVAYFLMSRVIGHGFSTWTGQDRLICSALSLVSWIAVIASGAVLIGIAISNIKYDRFIKNNKFIKIIVSFLKKLEPKNDKFQKE